LGNKLKALILAGGKGTRLRPLSCTRPKLLFPILNKPLLDWTLESLAKTGVTEVTLAVKHMAETFMQRYGDSKYGIKISYSKEERPMRTGGAIKYAEKIIGYEEPFLVINGDIFTKINYKTLLKKHKEKSTVATIALHRVEDPSRYGTVKLTEENQVTQFVEKAAPGKAPSNLINAGIYLMEPKIFEYIPGGRPVSIEHEVFPKLAKEGKLFGHESKEVWMDVGKPKDYLKANRILLDTEQRKITIGKDANLGREVTVNNPVLVAEGVTVGEKSRIGPYAIIGREVVLGKGIQLENSVVLPHATILDDAQVIGALIGEGATLGKGSKIREGCIIGDDVTIRDNITLSRDVTVCPSKEVNENAPESTRII
jgi:mannose-1-phosphate guanylyltransferase